MKNIFLKTTIFLFLFPFLVNAQTYAERLVDNIVDEIINPIIFVLFGIAMLVFIWGVISMFANAGDAKAVEKGKKHMVWGIIGLTVMAGTFGIMNLICVFIGAC